MASSGAARPSRRDVLRAAALAALCVGCSDGAAPVAAPIPTAPPTPSRRPSPPPPPSPSPAARLAAPLPWTAPPEEPLPEVKQVAADFVAALTLRAPATTTDDALERAVSLAASGFDAAAARTTASVLGAEVESAGDVVYAQFGGLSPLSPGARRASVMVVVRQRLRTRAGTEAAEVRTCDVRLVQEAGRWRVSALASAGGEPVARPAGLDPRAAAALDAPGLALPDTCRWDVHSGRVSPVLCDLLARCAQLAPLSVTVLDTGHPEQVFGTRRRSAHAVGRAVDVWEVGGVPVVRSAGASGPVAALLDAVAADRAVRQLGSPAGTDRDGRGRRSFSDLVHADHLHLAVG